jgi:MurNAc alpha-1-phosphate uridylyltransferase
MYLTDAVLLAAGHGKRMNELTSECPKALIRFQDIPLIFYTLAFLHKIGISRIFLNGYHEVNKLKKEIKIINKKEIINLSLVEENILRGTAGGLRGILEIHNIKTPFLLINCDILTYLPDSKIDNFKRIISDFTDDTCGKLFLVKARENQTPVDILEQGRLVFKDNGRYNYCGMSSWYSIIDYLPRKIPSELGKVWLEMTSKNLLEGVMFPLEFFSIGTYEEYFSLNSMFKDDSLSDKREILVKIAEEAGRFYSNFL